MTKGSISRAISKSRVCMYVSKACYSSLSVINSLTIVDYNFLDCRLTMDPLNLYTKRTISWIIWRLFVFLSIMSKLIQILHFSMQLFNGLGLIYSQ